MYIRYATDLNSRWTTEKCRLFSGLIEQRSKLNDRLKKEKNYV